MAVQLNAGPPRRFPVKGDFAPFPPSRPHGFGPRSDESRCGAAATRQVGPESPDTRFEPPALGAFWLFFRPDSLLPFGSSLGRIGR